MSTLPIVYRSFFNFKEAEEDVPDEFWGDEGAGALIIAKDTGRILLFLRSDWVNEPNTWNLVGGKIDEKEDPRKAVAREVEEETGLTGNLEASRLYTFRHKNFKYHNFLVLVPIEFTPKLNWEHSKAEWVEFGNWPEPLHFGLTDLLKHASNEIKKVVIHIKEKNEEPNIDETRLTKRNFDTEIERLENEWNRLDSMGGQEGKQQEISNKLQKLRKEKKNWETLYQTALNELDAPPAIVQPSMAKEKSPINITNAYILAATIWLEARGEGKEGMQAVLNVIMNRAHNNFDKAKDIAISPNQFSVWNKVKNKEKMAMTIADRCRSKTVEGCDMFPIALDLVDKAKKGILPDITDKATHYFNPRIVVPTWAKNMVKTNAGADKTGRIGRHIFYKNISKTS
jgi:8-oxo-dGTP pyrophosphatase MutT (NUDIX family)/spore germination cell wall hydrolase CwlJ-like protein